MLLDQLSHALFGEVHQLVHLVARLKQGGWTLLDTQFLTGHLAQFGALETPQTAYLKMLKPALKVRPDTAALTQPLRGSDTVSYALQDTTQASNTGC